MQRPITRPRVVRPRHRSDLLSRPRLLQMLQGLLDRQLLLVIAPAGYGKTSLLIDFTGTLDMPVCWYALSAADHNLHRFVAHFIAAITQQFADFGSDAEAALQDLEAGRIPLDRFVTLLVNELHERVRQRFLLVIDDYHLVDDSDAIGTFVSLFLQDVGETCLLILASRTLLTLPDLALLVARGAVDGLDFQELAFNPEEVQALAQQNYNQAISSAEAAEIVVSTEGWITGILLSANTHQLHLAGRLRLIRSSGIDLYSYLAQQVLAQQPAALRDFLLRSSLMDEFDGELCAAVMDPAWLRNGESWLDRMDELQRQNLFVTPLGQFGESLRYHHLFQEFLQHQIRRERPGEAQCILQRLVDFYRQREQWELAYLYAERLRDSSALVALVESIGLQVIHAGRILLVQEWLEKLTAPVIHTHPRLLGLQGYCSILLGQVDEGLHRLNAAEKALRSHPSDLLLAQVLAHRSIGLRLQGDYPQSIEDAGAALTLLDQLEEHPAHGSQAQPDQELPRLRALAYRSKGLGYCMMGDLDEGLIWQQRALDLYRATGDTQNVATLSMEIAITYDNAGQKALAQPLYAFALDSWRATNNLMGQATVLNSLGVYHQEQGDYRQAFTTLTQAIDCARRSGYVRMEAFALASLGDLLFETGLLQSAHSLYQEAYAPAQRADERFLVLYLELARAALAWSRGDWSIAYQCLDTAGRLVLSKNSSYEWALYRQAMGRYFVAQGSTQQALAPLQDALACFVQGGQTIDAARTHVYLAATYQAQAEQPLAVAALEAALTLMAELDCRHPVVVSAVALHDRLRNIPVAAPHRQGHSQFFANIESFRTQQATLRREFRKQVRVLFPHSSVDPPALMVHAFGQPEVAVNGRAITLGDWKTRVSRDLLFCLLAHPDGLTKEQIGMQFWPDCTTEQLRTRFKNAIYRMRNALHQEVVVRFDDGVYRFDDSLDYDYDVELFRQHVDVGDAASDPDAQIEAYSLAMRYYAGPYLPDTEAAWSYLEREELRQTYLSTALKLAQLTFRAGDHDSALEWCRCVLTEDPCDEDAHRLAMQVYASIGNRAGVARQYTLCQNALREEIAAPPSQQTEELYARLMQ